MSGTDRDTVPAHQPSELGDRAELSMAWRVHDLAAGSIGKADGKAGFVATLNTAVLGGVFTLLDLDQLATVPRAAVALGCVLIVAAIGLAVAVVLPWLRSREARHTNGERGNVLYFGTVRRHSPWGLADRLAGEDALYEVCAQSVILSRLSWTKHRLLQGSMWATIAGIALIGLTLLASGGAR